MPLCVTSCLAHVNLPFRFFYILVQCLGFYRFAYVWHTYICRFSYIEQPTLLFCLCLLCWPRVHLLPFPCFPPKICRHRRTPPHSAQIFLWPHTQTLRVSFAVFLLYSYFSIPVTFFSVFPSHFFQYFCHMILSVFLYLQALKCGWVSQWVCDNFIIISCGNMSATP